MLPRSSILRTKLIPARFVSVREDYTHQLTAQQSQGNKGKGQPGRVILVGEKDRQLARQRSQNGNRVSASLLPFPLRWGY
jgi:hypothetical protein